jgi:hypothetical protein
MAHIMAISAEPEAQKPCKVFAGYLKIVIAEAFFF